MYPRNLNRGGKETSIGTDSLQAASNLNVPPKSEESFISFKHNVQIKWVGLGSELQLVGINKTIVWW